MQGLGQAWRGVHTASAGRLPCVFRGGVAVKPRLYPERMERACGVLSRGLIFVFTGSGWWRSAGSYQGQPFRLWTHRP